MGAATVQAQIRTGSGSGSAANAEGGVSFSLDDSATGTTPIQIPTSTGTNYSWIRNLELHVTSTGTTTINNRTICSASSPSTGLKLHWKDVAVASYAQAASGNRPASSGSDGATPSGYTAMTTTPAQYDNTSVATSSTGANGDMAVTVLGVSSNYAGGPGSAISLPNILIGYDEF
jgi:hypothetical protein